MELYARSPICVKNVHLREDEECRKQPREMPECAKLHSLLHRVVNIGSIAVYLRRLYKAGRSLIFMVRQSCAGRKWSCAAMKSLTVRK